MLSVLIPVYNYNISNLVTDIHEQATKLNIEFEIICFDDSSSKYRKENELAVNSLERTTIFNSEENKGRTRARQLLCDRSNYEWLLFLDADVIPKSKNFIQKYINEKSQKYNAIFGGFAYSDKPPKVESMLRWKYGRNFEEVKAKKRNLNPYQIIISANFLIKKSLFKKIHPPLLVNRYGMDLYFASLLKQNKINVLHIDNEVYHLGLENSNLYLQKIKKALHTLLWAYNNKKMIRHSNRLLKLYKGLKSFKANYLIYYFYYILNPLIKKNLMGKTPNMKLLQLYKLLYLCHIDINHNRNA